MVELGREGIAGEGVTRRCRCPGKAPICTLPSRVGLEWPLSKKKPTLSFVLSPVNASWVADILG